MIPSVEEARHVENYRVWLRFNDGTEGEIDLERELWGEMFEPLRDINLFHMLRVEPDLDTIVWPNGADFSPEFLYNECRAAKTSLQKTGD